MKILTEISERLNSNTILLGVILLAGTILRFYNYWNLPYSYDEFSALFRTRFDNFSDLIRLGVVETDTHPAGVQVFMFLWVKIFGEGPMMVKLPFVVAGTASIYFTYKIAKEWFNAEVGLISAMFISFLQYPVTYSQYARPYASGLFLSVFFIWCLHKAFINRDKYFKWYFLAYVFSGAANAYNHHFSLFFMGLAAATGIFLIKRKNILPYLLANLLIFVLYIPHLKIFFAQLGKGGIETWLKKPTPEFFKNYLEYILHYNILMYILAGLLFVGSLFFVLKTIKKSNKYRIIILVWILVTNLTAYYYSLERNAVLQFSILIFIFPYLVMLIFSFTGHVNKLIKYLVVFVFGFVAIYSLITTREHYKIQYRSVFKEVVAEMEKATFDYTDNVTLVNNFRVEINDYYAGDFNIETSDIIRFDTLTSLIWFREQLNASNNDFLALGFVNIPDLEFLAVARELYPYTIEKKTYYTGDFYLMTKKITDSKNLVGNNDVVYKLHRDKREMYDYMTNLDYAMLWENERLRMPGWLGFTIFHESYLKDLVQNKYNYLLISAEVDNAQPDFESQMICEIKKADSTIYWLGTNFYEFIPNSDGSYHVHQALKLVDLNFDYTDEKIMIYLWNKDKAYYFLNNFTIEIIGGNTEIFALRQKFPK